MPQALANATNTRPSKDVAALRQPGSTSPANGPDEGDLNQAASVMPNIKNLLIDLGDPKGSIERLNKTAIDVICGSRVNFKLEYDENTKKPKGQIEIRTWSMGNYANYDTKYFNTAPDRIIVLELADLQDLDPVIRKQILKTRSGAYDGQEILKIIESFVSNLNTGNNENTNPAELRSAQRINRLFMPEPELMQGLYLVAKKASIKESKIPVELVQKALDKVAVWNKQSEDMDAKLPPHQKGWRLKIEVSDYAHELYKLKQLNRKQGGESEEQFTDRMAAILDAQLAQRLQSEMRVRDHKGIPIHKMGIFKKCVGFVKSRFKESVEFVKSGFKEPVKFVKSEFKESVEFLKSIFKSPVQFYKDSVYQDIYDCERIINSTFGFKVTKYRLADLKNKTDKYGYEVNSLGQRVKDREDDRSFLKRTKDNVMGFFFHGPGEHIKSWDYGKDDDINRASIDTGRSVSGLFRFLRMRKAIHYWNMYDEKGYKKNSGFIEILCGFNPDSIMSDSIDKALSIGDKFVFDHLKANKKYIWATSSFLAGWKASFNPNKGAINEKGFSEPTILLLHVHMQTIENARDYNFNSGVAQFSIVRIKNSIINGGFNDAHFSFCDIGDGLLGLLRGKKTLLGFGDGKKGAERVVFRGTKVKQYTVFEGAIDSGEFRMYMFSLNRFSAVISGMTNFKIAKPYSTFIRLRFWGLHYNEETAPAFKKSEPDPTELFWWYRYNQYSVKDHVQNLKAEMTRIYADGSVVQDDELQFWAELEQWIPNGINGRPHRIVFMGADPGDDQGNNKRTNFGTIEALFDEDVYSNHMMNCAKGQASFRVVHQKFDEKEPTKRDNRTFMGAMIERKHRLGAPMERKRKYRPVA